MSEHMKVRTRKDSVEFKITVPRDKAYMFMKLFKSSLELAGLEPMTNEDGEAVSVAEQADPATCLRGLRAKEGITQQQLADALGIGQSRVADYERGTRKISVAMAKKISGMYGVHYRCFL